MLKIVRAAPEDLETLKRICLQSKGHWRYPDHWMAQLAQSPIVTPESLSKDIVHKACVDAAIAGWYRLLPQAPIAILDDLWVLPQFMGKGIGRALFHHMLTHARSCGALAVELDADPNAVPFYERMGCRIIGQTLTEWQRLVPRMRLDLSTR